VRIPCPYCGDRDVREFSYLGDATVVRPDDALPDAEQAFVDYVYFRNNPAGLLREYWYHGFGCQSWIVVTRDTRNHEISSAELASPAIPTKVAT
jgi:heterotetrameric sarcosine oxidase delta subunit